MPVCRPEKQKQKQFLRFNPYILRLRRRASLIVCSSDALLFLPAEEAYPVLEWLLYRKYAREKLISPVGRALFGFHLAAAAAAVEPCGVWGSVFYEEGFPVTGMEGRAVAHLNTVTLPLFDQATSTGENYSPSYIWTDKLCLSLSWSGALLGVEQGGPSQAYI